MENTFLKWAGGKNWFVKNHRHRLPMEYNRYIDPFLGGGSVFFYMEPNEAIISDVNSELISTYIAIQQNWYEVNRKLQVHARRHNYDYYYKVREQQPKVLTSIAARMIYLNRTCFNGIYRVNQKGKFNVPKGSKDSVITGLEKLEQRARLLRNVDIRCCDFEITINEAQADDFLFCDPPYAVQDEDSFVGYTRNLFSWSDQVRLADALERAKARNVKIMMTNVNHPSIRALYEGKEGFIIEEVSRYSSISGKAGGRKQYSELIVSVNI